MKEIILDKATEMFLNLGFKSVTMDDLANEVGISKKTIYTHYENKTKLVQECTTRLFNKINEGIDTICAIGKNPIEELYDIKKYVIFHLKDEKSSPQYQLQKYYPKIFRHINAKQSELMQKCTINNLNRGLEMGIYREDINIDFVSRIYISGIYSIQDPEMFPQPIFPVEQLKDLFLEYHLRGIVTPKGRKILNGVINSNHE
ncbi:Nucleoid occlusion factor SlmA [Arenibacter antarcticus]|uniref:TetR/AcrR family transcriptional regulator n=1 Tax=Arenibacter antarcticus TaxID=2040469 RepID=A0ABW5V9L8_9FLAO|nr:TetR/AcrR family transcriptional regulator [Arenibacter sp. H213]MCM4168028.1 TetR family transcriptional regulator [Arenibacter sp. H213]